MANKSLFEIPAVFRKFKLIYSISSAGYKKRKMEDQIISKAPELDESEIKALIENFETIGILLKEHPAFFKNPLISPESKKIFNEGLVLIENFTHECLRHYGLRYLSK